MGKRSVIVIEGTNFKFFEFRRLVFSYKTILEERQLEKINVLWDLNIHTIGLIYSADISHSDPVANEVIKNIIDECKCLYQKT